MEDMIEALQIYFSRANAWTPLWVTLKTGIAATFITFFTGLFAAARVMRLPSGKKAVADSILTLPIVLPPTVVGFVLLLLFSRNRLLGKTLNLAFGVVIPGTWAACVIAAVVISFPLMYRNTRAAFEHDDLCGPYTGVVRMGHFLENQCAECTAGDCFGNGAGICPGDRRIRSHIHVCRKYSWKNKYHFSADCCSDGQ